MASDNLLGFILKDEEFSKKMLIRAVNKGETEVIEKVVNYLPSIDERKKDDIIWTVIHVTISELTSEVFEMLIKNGPPTYYTTGNTISCRTAHCVFVRVAHCVNLNLFDYCVNKKRNDLLRKLFEKYDIDPIEFEGNGNCGWYNAPYLFTTLMDCNYEGAKLLIEHGADINQLCAPINKGWSHPHPYTYGLRYQPHCESDGEPHYPLCYQVLKHCSEGSRDALVKFMLDSGADLSDPEKLRLNCKDESIIKKVEDFYREPKKRAKPNQD